MSTEPQTEPKPLEFPETLHVYYHYFSKDCPPEMVFTRALKDIPERMDGKPVATYKLVERAVLKMDRTLIPQP